MIYKLFDLYWDIETKFKKTSIYLQDYICLSDVSADVKIKITDEEIKDEQKKYPGYDEIYHELICIFRHISQEILLYDGIFVHSSVVALDNQGYMFLGKSGAGKSTHAMLWEKYFHGRAEIINGDKPIIRIINNEIYAYGNPWGGKEGKHINKRVRVRCGCFVVQSDVNRIRKLNSNECFKLMINQVTIRANPQLRIKFFELLNKFLSSVSFYVLECDISEEAVLTAYDFMRGEIQ